jgi:hypothetical protein
VKLRLLDDTIRLRLSRGDVAAVDKEGVVEAKTHFPDGAAFRFALESSAGGSVSAEFTGNRMVVRLPKADISAWANDDSAVSLHGEVQLAENAALTLLVEKDFQCLTPRPDEDQTDLFSNPDSTAC